MSKLDEVLADLATESEQLETLVSELADAQWRTPTPAPGWDIATQVGHLAWTDEVATLAATDKASWDAIVLQAMQDPEGFVDTQAIQVGRATPTELLARWQRSRAALTTALRHFPDGEKLPWFGPPMSPVSMATARFMETWAHSLDVRDALGSTLAATDRVRHIVFLGTRTRSFAFVTNKLAAPTEDVRVRLTLPSGEIWEDGPADAQNTVTGSAYDFALRVTQRRHRDDLDLVATGPVADRWLDIAQAFAGPPGAGRAAA